MQPQALDKDELSIINNVNEDLVLLEIIKGMNFQELCSFDQYRPLCIGHYNKVQVRWLKTEETLIINREGHSDFLDEDELIEDMEVNNNPQRFRTYYVLKYPAFVEPISKQTQE